MYILSLFALFFAVLSAVTVADSVPQLTDLLDQNYLASTIAFNPDSPQNEIAKSEFSTNPTDLYGSSADPKDLTESTDNAQISSFLSNNLATLVTYDPNAPSNPNGSPDSIIPSHSDATLLTSDQTLPSTTEDDSKIAQEVVPLNEVLPKTVPGVAIPPGGDIILAPSDWRDLKPGDTFDAKPDTAVEPDVGEDDPVECDPDRWSFCCWLPAPDPVNGQISYRGNLKLFDVRRDCHKSTFQV